MSKWIKLDDVVLWDNNPNEGDLGALITTVKKIGYIETVNIWQNNEVRAGNHRVKALLELRRQKWQPFGGCVRVNERGEWEIEYIDISNLSPLEANTYGLASNRITRLGYDNQPLAVGLLEEIRIADNELFLATGFDGDMLDDMINGFNPMPPDDFPSFDDTIETEYCCPKCGYEWSGKPR